MHRARLSRRIALAVSLTIIVALAAAQPVVHSVAQQATPSPQAEPAASPEASPIASPVAETGPVEAVFAAGNFRIAVVAAARGEEIAAVNLTPKAGKDWIVVVADATNWSTKTATLRIRDFAIRLTGGAEPRGLASRSTQTAAERLGLEPKSVNAGVKIARDQTTRIALVFQIDHDGANPALFDAGQALPLAQSLVATTDFAALPPAAAPPALEVARVEDVTNGATLTLANGGGTVRLAALDPPLPAECFGGKSTARLKKLAGDEVLLEPAADGSAYVWAEQTGGSRKLLNEDLLASGFAALQSNPTGPYAAWFTDGEETARSLLAGLWGACTSAHGVARAAGPERAVLDVRSDDVNRTYAPWGFRDWRPTLVTTPDGGAWAFFSAKTADGPDKDHARLYASHYDPATGGWTPATAMPGGDYQYGASAVVDGRGLVHLVYSDQGKGGTDDFAVLMYTHEDGSGGWTDPVPVAPSANAGHQLAASLAIDKNGTLHVLWRDQRAFPAGSSTPNADVFASDLPPGGEWTEPVEVNQHVPTATGAWPKVVVDGDRLVAVWSVYTSTTGTENAAHVDWATRPLDDPKGWTTPESLVYGRGEKFGGRYVALAADPNGGVVLAFARQLNDIFLFVRRLPADSTEWSGDTLITAGDRGAFPSVTVNQQGTVYVVYNVGQSSVVDVGATALPFRAIEPGPERLLTQDDPNSQGLAVVTTDQTGSPWVIYVSQQNGAPAVDKVFVLRDANIPAGETGT
jgi:endonuclease YncB( thermonuclease family)